MNMQRVLTSLALVLLLVVPASQAASTGIVRSVASAPVTSDGIVAGAVTDLVINLDRSMDPSVAGRGLMAGNQIRVTLPDDFVNLGFPIGSPFEGCGPDCSAAILIQGWPQHPVGAFIGAPGVGEWTVFGEGTHTIVFEAREDIVPSPPEEPGIKVLHMLLRGFRNPAEGHYDIQVEAETGPEGAVETGVARVEIIPRVRSAISVTSIFNGPPNRNTIYQQTSPSELVPLPYDFLLWGPNRVPLTGVKVVGPRFGGPGSGAIRLDQDGRTVGGVSVVGPEGATGFQVLTSAPSAEISAPVTGVPTARMTVFFRAGDLPGLYTINFKLNGGNDMTMFVNVVE